MNGTTRIERIEVRHEKHPSCSYSAGTIEIDGDDDHKMTRAAFALAEVHKARAELESVGSGGNIGCGSFSLVLIVDVEDSEEYQELDAESEEGRALVASLPPGTVRPETVAELSEPVWDGSNWTAPDVSGIAGNLDSAGHWSAGDWLSGASLDGTEDADELIRDAEACGVHLDCNEVRAYLKTRTEGRT